MTFANQTSILKTNSPTLRLALNRQVAGFHGTTTLEQTCEVILLVRGLPERILLSETKPCTLGRFDLDPSQIVGSLVNLSPYGADNRGVSRRHASLHVQQNKVYLTDIGSTNGTFVAGQRLTPHEPMLLHKGQDILLGRLTIQFLVH